MAWGIEDETHRVVGTTFKPKQTKAGNIENIFLVITVAHI